MQTIAQSILVLHLTGSGVDLGLVSAFAFLPVLIFGAPAGLIADRIQKRRLLLVTQSLLALQALTLGILTQLGVVRLSMVYGLALVMGFVNAIISMDSWLSFISGPFLCMVECLLINPSCR